MVEFHSSADGTNLIHYEGKWLPTPVEYKRGKPKTTDAYILQLCAQAVCLEEIFNCTIEKGALYYNEIKHRENIDIDLAIRTQLEKVVTQMHDFYDQRYTPKVKAKKECKSCSLSNICMPYLNEQFDISEYIKKNVGEFK